MWCGGVCSQGADVHVEEAWGEQSDRGAGGVQSCGCDVVVKEIVGIGIELKGGQSVGFPAFLIIEEEKGCVESEEIHGAERGWAADLEVNGSRQDKNRKRRKARQARGRAGERREEDRSRKGRTTGDGQNTTKDAIFLLGRTRVACKRSSVRVSRSQGSHAGNALPKN